jgi:hypothetical protein
MEGTGFRQPSVRKAGPAHAEKKTMTKVYGSNDKVVGFILARSAQYEAYDLRGHSYGLFASATAAACRVKSGIMGEDSICAIKDSAPPSRPRRDTCGT